MPKPALDIEQLSTEERLDLIEQLWDSLADADVPLSAAESEELTRRLDALDMDGPVGLPWEQVHSEMDGRGK